MPKKSLADILASPDVGLPETVFPLCLAGKLRAEMERLQEAALVAEGEAKAALEEAQAQRDGEGGGKPARMGAVSPVTAKRQAADAAWEAFEAVLDRRKAATVAVRFRAFPPGEWREWRAANPAREDNQDDLTEMRGHCSTDALMSALFAFVVDGNGEQITEHQWAQMVSTVAARDMVDAAKAVLALHEAQVRDPGKDWLRSWRELQRSDTD
jgi:hypothetical protein